MHWRARNAPRDNRVRGRLPSRDDRSLPPGSRTPSAVPAGSAPRRCPEKRRSAASRISLERSASPDCSIASASRNTAGRSSGRSARAAWNASRASPVWPRSVRVTPSKYAHSNSLGSRARLRAKHWAAAWYWPYAYSVRPSVPTTAASPGAAIACSQADPSCSRTAGARPSSAGSPIEGIPRSEQLIASATQSTIRVEAQRRDFA